MNIGPELEQGIGCDKWETSSNEQSIKAKVSRNYEDHFSQLTASYCTKGIKHLHISMYMYVVSHWFTGSLTVSDAYNITTVKLSQRGWNVHSWCPLNEWKYISIRQQNIIQKISKATKYIYVDIFKVF
jgi:hypothetical protein